MADKEQIVALTGLPVSEEMKAILKQCEKGEYVSVEEINATPEMRTAASCVSHQTPTIQLKDREQIEAHVFDILSNYGSVSTDKYGRSLVDESGNTRYNDIVDQGSRLDIVIGLPASGKSSAIVETISKEHHSMLIDNDEAKRLFPEFNKGWGAGVVHAESQMVERDVYLDAILQGKNIVLPKVGSDANKLLMDYILPAKLQGYKVNVHFVNLDRNKALGRMLNRFINKGRYLAPELIDKYANERDGNRIAKAYAELSESGMVDGMSRWDNDVSYNELPKLKETKGLTDKFIVDADINELTETKIVEGIREVFDKSGIDTYISDHDIEMQLSIRIDERLNMNYFYEDPESVDDVDYMVILKQAMHDNLTDMQYTLEEIHKAVGMIEGGREALPPNVQDAIVNFEFYTARQESDFNIMNDMYSKAEKKREALRKSVQSRRTEKESVTNDNVNRSEENGGMNHEGNKPDRRNDEESHTRSTGEFRASGDGRNDRGSDAQGFDGDKREMGGDKGTSERGSQQAEARDNEEVHGRSSESVDRKVLYMDENYEPVYDRSIDGVDENTKALAVKIADRYISVESNGQDWEYMICDEDFGLLYGSKYPDSGARIDEVVNSIIDELKTANVQRMQPLIYPQMVGLVSGHIMPEDTFEVVENFKELSNRVDRNENDKVKNSYENEAASPDVVEQFRAKTDELFHKIDDRSASEIEQDVLSTVKSIISDYDIDATAIDAVLTGSRCRGIENADSDIDVVVEIHGENEHEDSLFNLLNEEKLRIGGVEVDINPILPQESGTLAEYLPNVEEYLEEKMSTLHQVDVNVQSEQNVVKESEDYKRAYDIAAKLDEWGQDFDIHEYNDTVEDCAAHVEELTARIMDGQIEGLKDYLQVAIDEGDKDDDIIIRAEAILKELNEYKPLAKVEEIEEQNYNMIDNRINNTEPKDEKQPGKKAEKQAEKETEIETEIETEKEDAGVAEEKKQISTGKAFPGAKYSNFKIKKNVEDAKYLLIADIKMPDKELIEGQAIGEFKDKETVVAFCKQNNIAYDDITNYLQNMIEHKKKQVKEKSDKAPDKGSPELGKKGKGAGIDDD